MDAKTISKIKEMQQHVPFLEIFITQSNLHHDDEKDLDAQRKSQFQKLKMLYTVLTTSDESHPKSSCKLPYDTLLKCESILIKLRIKLDKTFVPSTKMTDLMDLEDVSSPMADFSEISPSESSPTPASPPPASPPASPPPFNPGFVTAPIEIPTERQHSPVERHERRHHQRHHRSRHADQHKSHHDAYEHHGRDQTRSSEHRIWDRSSGTRDREPERNRSFDYERVKIHDDLERRHKTDRDWHAERDRHGDRLRYHEYDPYNDHNRHIERDRHSHRSRHPAYSRSGEHDTLYERHKQIDHFERDDWSRSGCIERRPPERLIANMRLYDGDFPANPLTSKIIHHSPPDSWNEVPPKKAPHAAVPQKKLNELLAMVKKAPELEHLNKSIAQVSQHKVSPDTAVKNILERLGKKNAISSESIPKATTNTAPISVPVPVPTIAEVLKSPPLSDLDITNLFKESGDEDVKIEDICTRRTPKVNETPAVPAPSEKPTLEMVRKKLATIAKNSMESPASPIGSPTAAPALPNERIALKYHPHPKITDEHVTTAANPTIANVNSNVNILPSINTQDPRLRRQSMMLQANSSLPSNTQNNSNLPTGRMAHSVLFNATNVQGTDGIYGSHASNTLPRNTQHIPPLIWNNPLDNTRSGRGDIKGTPAGCSSLNVPFKEQANVETFGAAQMRPTAPGMLTTSRKPLLSNPSTALVPPPTRAPHMPAPHSHNNQTQQSVANNATLSRFNPKLNDNRERVKYNETKMNKTVQKPANYGEYKKAKELENKRAQEEKQAAAAAARRAPVAAGVSTANKAAAPKAADPEKAKPEEKSEDKPIAPSNLDKLYRNANFSAVTFPTSKLSFKIPKKPGPANSASTKETEKKAVNDEETKTQKSNKNSEKQQIGEIEKKAVNDEESKTQKSNKNSEKQQIAEIEKKAANDEATKTQKSNKNSEKQIAEQQNNSEKDKESEKKRRDDDNNEKEKENATQEPIAKSENKPFAEKEVEKPKNKKAQNKDEQIVVEKEKNKNVAKEMKPQIKEIDKPIDEERNNANIEVKMETADNTPPTIIVKIEENNEDDVDNNKDVVSGVEATTNEIESPGSTASESAAPAKSDSAAVTTSEVEKQTEQSVDRPLENKAELPKVSGGDVEVAKPPTTLKNEVPVMPRRILRRRCTMFEFDSAPVVSKEKILAAINWEFDKKQKVDETNKPATPTMGRRFKTANAVVFEPTDDNCTVSTQNIITGKRRTRATINFNETAIMSGLFKQRSAGKETPTTAAPKEAAATPPKTITKKSVQEKRAAASTPPIIADEGSNESTTRPSRGAAVAAAEAIKSSISKQSPKIPTTDPATTGHKSTPKAIKTTTSAGNTPNTQKTAKAKAAVRPKGNTTTPVSQGPGRPRKRRKSIDSKSTTSDCETEMSDFSAFLDSASITTTTSTETNNSVSSQHIPSLFEELEGTLLMETIADKVLAPNFNLDAELETYKQIFNKEKFEGIKSMITMLLDTNQNENSITSNAGQKPTMVARKGRKGELEKLNEDIREMFICKGVLTATGRRLCTMSSAAKTAESKAKPTKPPKQLDIRKPRKLRVSVKRLKLPVRVRTNDVVERRLTRTPNAKKKEILIKNEMSADEGPKSSDALDVNVEGEFDNNSLNLTQTSEEIPLIELQEHLKNMPKLKPNSPVELQADEVYLLHSDVTRKRSAPSTRDRFVGPKCKKLARLVQGQYENSDSSEPDMENNELGSELGVAEADDNSDNSPSDGEDSTNTDTTTNKNEGLELEEVIASGPLVKQPIRNTNPNWHLNSLYVNTCLICLKDLRYPAVHYLQHHGEYYPSRLAASVLLQYKKHVEQLCKPKFGINGVKSRKVKWFHLCCFCTELRTLSTHHWREHFKRHTGEYNFQCSKCDRPICDTTRFRAHATNFCEGATQIKTDYDYGAKQPLKVIHAHVCHLCNFIQLARSNLERHYRIQHAIEQEHIKDMGYTLKLLDITNVRMVDEQKAILLKQQEYLKTGNKSTLSISDTDNEKKPEVKNIEEKTAKQDSPPPVKENDEVAASVPSSNPSETTDKDSAVQSNVFTCSVRETNNSPTLHNFANSYFDTTESAQLPDSRMAPEKPTFSMAERLSQRIKELDKNAAASKQNAQQNVKLPQSDNLAVPSEQIVDQCEASTTNDSKSAPTERNLLLTVELSDSSNDAQVINSCEESIAEPNTIIPRRAFEELSKITTSPQCVKDTSEPPPLMWHHRREKGFSLRDINTTTSLEDLLERMRSRKPEAKVPAVTESAQASPAPSGISDFMHGEDNVTTSSFDTATNSQADDSNIVVANASNEDEDDNWEDIEITETAPAIEVHKSGLSTSKSHNKNKYKSMLQKFNCLYNIAATNKCNPRAKKAHHNSSKMNKANKKVYEQNTPASEMCLSPAEATVELEPMSNSLSSATQIHNEALQLEQCVNENQTPITGFRPLITSLDDLLPGSPCQDPIDLVADLTSIEPLQELDIDTLLDLTESQQDALDFVKEQECNEPLLTNDNNCESQVVSNANNYVTISKASSKQRVQNFAYTRIDSERTQYFCMLEKCDFFFSSDSTGVEQHMLRDHTSVSWNGYCELCGVFVMSGEFDVTLEMKHMLEEHVNAKPLQLCDIEKQIQNENSNSDSNSERPRIKLRRLSGDCLSSTPPISNEAIDVHNIQNTSLIDLLAAKSKPPPLTMSRQMGILQVDPSLTIETVTSLAEQAILPDTRPESGVQQLQISNVVSLHDENTENPSAASTSSAVINSNDGDVKATQMPVITNVCSLNCDDTSTNTTTDLWKRKIAAESNEVAQAIADARSAQRAKLKKLRVSNSPEPIVVAETVPMAQATAGPFVITQTLSAQYSEHSDMRPNNAQLGLNISILPQGNDTPGTTAATSSTAAIPLASITRKTKAAGSSPTREGRTSSTKEANEAEEAESPSPTPSLTVDARTVANLNCMQPNCKFQTCLLMSMRDHLLFHSNHNFSKQNDYLKCSICQFSAKNVYDYVLHMQQKHLMENETVLDTFYDKLKMTIEEIVAKTGIASEKLYKCVFNYCNAKLDENSYISHIVYHGSNMPPGKDSAGNSIKCTYKCPFCPQSYVNPRAVKAHLKSHGIHRYFCYMCYETADSYSNIFKHYRDKHRRVKDLLSHLLLRKPCKSTQTTTRNNDENTYLVCCQRQLTHLEVTEYGQKLIENWERKKALEKDDFMPDEIELLPMQAIFQKDVHCAVCKYKTKVRTNMYRHLQWHKTTQSSTATSNDDVIEVAHDPVNPVPCLETNEKFFDKMTNLAAASVLVANGKSASRSNKTKTLKVKYAYVCDKNRLTCGVDDCHYLTVTEDLLRAHLTTLHAYVTNYKCPFCKEVVCKNFNVDRIMQHTRLHGSKIFQCEECGFVHYQKSVVGRHIRDNHGKLRVKRRNITRRVDGEFDDYVGGKKVPDKSGNAEGNSAAAAQLVDGNVATDTAVAKVSEQSSTKFKWCCCLCNHSALRQSQIVEHCQAQHNRKHPYECPYCPITAVQISIMLTHIDSKHPGQSRKFVKVYTKMMRTTEDAITVIPAPAPALNTQPLWQRNRSNHSRFIRNIPMENEEESAMHTKRIRLEEYDDESNDNVEDKDETNVDEIDIVDLDDEPSPSQQNANSQVTTGTSNTSKQVLQANSSTSECNKAMLEQYTFKCEYCDITGDYNTLRCEHWPKTHHSNSFEEHPFLCRLIQVVQCSVCRKFKGSLQQLEVHLKESHNLSGFFACDPNVPELQCAFCDFKPQTHKQFPLHFARSKHPPEQLKYPITETTTFINKLGSFLSYYQCTKCFHIFGNAYSVISHKCVDQNADRISSNTIKNQLMYRCSVCAFVSIQEQVALRHMVDHYWLFQMCKYCLQPQEGFVSCMQHVYAEHRDEVPNFKKDYRFPPIKSFLVKLQIILPNGVIIAKKDLLKTAYGSCDKIRSLYNELFILSQQPPIPRFALGRLLSKNNIESVDSQIQDITTTATATKKTTDTSTVKPSSKVITTAKRSNGDAADGTIIAAKHAIKKRRMTLHDGMLSPMTQSTELDTIDYNLTSTSNILKRKISEFRSTPTASLLINPYNRSKEL